VNEIKELVHLIRVIPQLTHRRLAENDIMNVNRTQGHRITSGLLTISTGVPDPTATPPHHGLSDNEPSPLR
jgi:hypothetical protein